MKTSNEAKGSPERIKEELVDVLFYAYLMAENMEFDIEEIIHEMLIKNMKK